VGMVAMMELGAGGMQPTRWRARLMPLGQARSRHGARARLMPLGQTGAGHRACLRLMPLDRFKARIGHALATDAGRC